ncbi:MAG: DUF5522 domain-containing protein [Pyrinomonadaceae bacterium]
MQNNDEKDPHPDEIVETFVEGIDFYFEEDFMVLTRRFLANRGYCCGNDCRHCPYTGTEEKTLE